MKIYKAHDINGEDGCFVHTGDNQYVLKYESICEPSGPQFASVTNVATKYDAIRFLEFVYCGYAEHIESYEPEEYDWLKENGLPIDFSGKLKYMQYLHEK